MGSLNLIPLLRGGNWLMGPILSCGWQQVRDIALCVEPCYFYNFKFKTRYCAVLSILVHVTRPRVYFCPRGYEVSLIGFAGRSFSITSLQFV